LKKVNFKAGMVEQKITHTRIEAPQCGYVDFRIHPSICRVDNSMNPAFCFPGARQISSVKQKEPGSRSGQRGYLGGTSRSP
jgi:hypothetical protein